MGDLHIRDLLAVTEAEIEWEVNTSHNLGKIEYKCDICWKAAHSTSSSSW
jgi:hypothetical protein